MIKTPSDFLYLQSPTSIAGRCTRASERPCPRAAEKRDEASASHGTINPGGPLPAVENIGSEEARQRHSATGHTQEVGLGSKH
jgi:hypothetical protein